MISIQESLPLYLTSLLGTHIITTTIGQILTQTGGYKYSICAILMLYTYYQYFYIYSSTLDLLCIASVLKS